MIDLVQHRFSFDKSTIARCSGSRRRDNVNRQHDDGVMDVSSGAE